MKLDMVIRNKLGRMKKMQPRTEKEEQIMDAWIAALNWVLE